MIINTGVINKKEYIKVPHQNNQYLVQKINLILEWGGLASENHWMGHQLNKRFMNKKGLLGFNFLMGQKMERNYIWVLKFKIFQLLMVGY